MYAPLNCHPKEMINIQSLMKYGITVLLTMCLACYNVIEARMNYIKDQSMDAVFPGPVYKQTANMPDGHMRPLGWQRKPDAPITEQSQMPDTREFYTKFVSTETPVVFRRVITQAPAFIKWAEDDYLNEKYGDVNVTVRVKLARKQSRILSEERVMNLTKFLFDYMYDEMYIDSVLSREMMSDLPFPKCVRCGTISENLVAARLLMSSGPTASRIQSHDDHHFQCVLFGRRDFILIEEVHKKTLPFMYDYPNSLGGYSDMDVDRVNAYEYKNVLRIPWTWSTLFPGDCVFIPSGYIYQVRSYSRSVSIDVQFVLIKELHSDVCQQTTEKDFVPLSDAYYLLAFEDGRLRLSDLELDAEKLRHILISLTDKNDVLSDRKFAHFYFQVLGEDKSLPSPHQVFELLTESKQAEILKKNVLLTMDSSRLQKVVDIFNIKYAELLKKEAEMTLEETLATSEESKHVHEEF